MCVFLNLTSVNVALRPGLLLGGRPDGRNDSGVTGTWGRSGLCPSASPLTSAAPQTGTVSAPNSDRCSQEQALCSLLPPGEPPSAPGRCSSSAPCSQLSPHLLLSLQTLLQPPEPDVRTPSQEPSPVRKSETSGVFLAQSCESRPASRGRDSELLLGPACLFSAAPRPSIPTPPRSDRCSSRSNPGSHLDRRLWPCCDRDPVLLCRSGLAGSDSKFERPQSDVATQTSGVLNKAGRFLSAPARPSGVELPSSTFPLISACFQQLRVHLLTINRSMWT